MTVDLEFLMFLIAFTGALFGGFGVVLRFIVKMSNHIVEMDANLKGFMERDRCEMQRVNNRLDDVEEITQDHEGRLGRLEAKYRTD